MLSAFSRPSSRGFASLRLKADSRGLCRPASRDRSRHRPSAAGTEPSPPSRDESRAKASQFRATQSHSELAFSSLVSFPLSPKGFERALSQLLRNATTCHLMSFTQRFKASSGGSRSSTLPPREVLLLDVCLVVLRLGGSRRPGRPHT